MANALPKEEVDRRIEAYVDHNYSSREASKALGIDRRSLDRTILAYAPDIKTHTATMGRIEQTEVEHLSLPEEGEVKRYILTCAQNNTRVHTKLLKNLEAFARHVDADIHISRFTYNRAAYKKSSKAGSEVATEETYYDPVIAPYASDEILMLAPGLAWCGNLQISPTAVSPWTGFQDYTGAASSVIPHPKVSMIPVATPRSAPTKHLYTTGCITMLNYIAAKAGQKAEFHHTFAALLVEVLPDGSWFARQLTADRDGGFCDHPYKVSRGKVTQAAKVVAVQWGDIHVANIDERIKDMFWGKGGALDTLRPRQQLFHDLVDGESHNHHARKDHHEQYRLARTGRNCIRGEFDAAREFVDEFAHRKWCAGHVIWSNHDEFIRRYLQDSNYKTDPVNALFILRLETAIHEGIEEERDVSPFEIALASNQCDVLTDDDGSFLIEGIQAGFHGHAGQGGSRGSVAQFAKLGLKTMSGHSHAAWLINGASSAGTCSDFDLGYNKGPSSWSHTFTLVYQGGKRQQITANAETGMWRAGWKL